MNQDHPGVIAVPPLLYGAVFVLAFILGRLFPLHMFRGPAVLWGGIVLTAGGFGLMSWGVIWMRSAGTNLSPRKPATALVTSGPFRFSRNPLYVALTLAYVGLSFTINTGWALILLLPLLPLMHYGVILREERYLTQKFGEAYREYCAKVRRYF